MAIRADESVSGNRKILPSEDSFEKQELLGASRAAAESDSSDTQSHNIRLGVRRNYRLRIIPSPARGDLGSRINHAVIASQEDTYNQGLVTDSSRLSSKLSRSQTWRRSKRWRNSKGSCACCNEVVKATKLSVSHLIVSAKLAADTVFWADVCQRSGGDILHSRTTGSIPRKCRA